MLLHDSQGAGGWRRCRTRCTPDRTARRGRTGEKGAELPGAVASAAGAMTFPVFTSSAANRSVCRADVVGVRRSTWPGRIGSTGSGALERLDRGLLVHAQHQGTLGRAHAALGLPRLLGAVPADWSGQRQACWHRAVGENCMSSHARWRPRHGPARRLSAAGRRYAVPLGQAAPAARGRGVRATNTGCPRRASAFRQWRARRREPLGDEGAGVGQDGFLAPDPHVVPLAPCESEAAPERRVRQPSKDLV